MTDPVRMSTATTEQVVSISSVNPTDNIAIGLTRQQTLLQIDTRYHAGAVHVTPAVGEQWFVKRRGTCWVLEQKLPYNTEVLLHVADNPVPGQVQVGSTGPGAGPLHLHGTQVNVNGPLRLHVTTADTRPQAGAVEAGITVFDADLGKPLYFDGSNWRDAVGTAFCGIQLSGVGTVSAWTAILRDVSTSVSGQGALSATATAVV